MKEAFEKIIERLEEETQYQQRKADETLAIYKISQKQARQKMRECYDHAIEIVKEVAEKYNDGWIPCSEKLPYDDENIKRYIVYLENGRIDVLGFVKDAYKYQPSDFYEYKGKHKPIFYDYDPEYGYVENDDVIAWQPPPQPYQPKGEK